MKIKKVRKKFDSQLEELEVILLEMSPKGLYHNRLNTIVNKLKECVCVFEYGEYVDMCNKKIPDKVRKMVDDVFDTPNVEDFV